jgi:hypothetical protein
LVPPGHRRTDPAAKAQRKTMPAILPEGIADWRKRIETTFKEISD